MVRLVDLHALSLPMGLGSFGSVCMAILYASLRGTMAYAHCRLSFLLYKHINLDNDHRYDQTSSRYVD
jgi:hypothetical protein